MNFGGGGVGFTGIGFGGSDENLGSRSPALVILKFQSMEPPLYAKGPSVVAVEVAPSFNARTASELNRNGSNVF